MSHGGEMDWFRVTLHLAGATGERFQLMEALVDTGASYTWIPRDVLEGLGVRPDEERVFVLADGRAVRYHSLGPRPARRTHPADPRRLR